METISSVGKGYYNYYHLSNRYETEAGKANIAWYDRDLSVEEINSNNDVLNREYQGADICRKVADKFQGIAASNRSKYSSVDEMKSAVWAKYSLETAYKNLSRREKEALARTEIDMTLFGVVELEEARIVAGIKGDFTKNTLGRSEDKNRAFNINMLGKQIGNVFKNNGFDLSLIGNKTFKFSINGMTNKLSIMLLDDNGEITNDSNLIGGMTKLLNSKDYAKNLFYNILYDSNKQGLIPNDQLSKWRLFSEFRNITGLDIRDFEQTKEGFISKEGQSANDIYKEALKYSSKVPTEFKGDTYDYFLRLEENAMEYNISEVQDLTLSLEYQNGYVKFPDGAGRFDISV